MATLRRSTQSAVIEAFEARRLMATVVVANTQDSGAGSLRQAMVDANPGDTIDLTGVSGTITLASTLTITKPLTINGPGTATLTISGNHHTVRGFTIESDMTVVLRDLTVADAGTPGEFGGAIYAKSNRTGYSLGDEYGFSSLTLDRIRLTNNRATIAGGGLMARNTHVVMTDCTIDNNVADVGASSMAVGGGAVVDGGLLVAKGCTFSGNQVVAVRTSGQPAYVSAQGGGLYFGGNNAGAHVSNCTFVGNSAIAGGATTNDATGGGLELGSSSNTFALDHVTVVGNTASSGGSGSRYGGGIRTQAGHTPTMTNSLVANNVANVAPDVCSVNTISGSYNLIGNGDGSTLTNGSSHNRLGSLASPLDPKLGTLTDNGGKTQTIALLATSPAINAGVASDVTADQRGVPHDGVPDIGAFERPEPAPTPQPPSSDAPAITNGGLKVSGTLGDDTILIAHPGSRNDTVRVTRGQRSWNFSKSMISSIEVDALAGDDRVQINVRGLAVYAFGNEGNDVLLGGVTHDTLAGGAGDDTLYGLDGDDFLTGHAGRDRLFGGVGKDRLYGGNGNDRLSGDEDRDRLWGDAGGDVFLVRDGSRDAVVGDTLDAAMIDRLDLLTGITTLL